MAEPFNVAVQNLLQPLRRKRVQIQRHFRDFQGVEAHGERLTFKLKHLRAFRNAKIYFHHGEGLVFKFKGILEHFKVLLSKIFFNHGVEKGFTFKGILEHFKVLLSEVFKMQKFSFTMLKY